MQKLFLLAAAAFAVCGCATERPRAIINDLTVREEFDSGYALVAVDGKPVQRADREISTAPPYAWIDSGEHQLTLRPKHSDSKDPTLQSEVTISAKVEPYKRYRLAKQNDKVSLVEDF